MALTLLRHPEVEHKGDEKPLRDLVFNYLLVQPELEGVRAMAWLQAKVNEKRSALWVYLRCKTCHMGEVCAVTTRVIFRSAQLLSVKQYVCGSATQYNTVIICVIVGPVDNVGGLGDITAAKLVCDTSAIGEVHTNNWRQWVNACEKAK